VLESEIYVRSYWKIVGTIVLKVFRSSICSEVVVDLVVLIFVKGWSRKESLRGKKLFQVYVGVRAYNRYSS